MTGYSWNMTIKYNPQLKIEIVRLIPEGEEEPIDVQIIPEDLSHHSGNKPPRCQVNIQKALGSVQQQCTITLHNAPIIEEIRREFASLIPKLRDEYWRVKIWAWWSNSPDKTEPNVPPVFIGEISDDFQVQSSGINDSTLTLTAHGHQYLMRSGKMKKTWAAATTYRTIVEEIFEYFNAEKRYNGRVLIQDGFAVLDQELIRSFNIDSNPVEELNNICGELDLVWGIDTQTLYVLGREEGFTGPEFTPPNFNPVFPEIDFSTGNTSLLSFGKWAFSFGMLYDHQITLGRFISIKESPQINSSETVLGRVNEISYQLDNYIGHSMNISCQHTLNDGPIPTVDLPPRRDDASGQRYQG